MKKLALLIALAAVSVASFASVGDSATTSVNLTIDKFVAISFTSGSSFSYTISNGGQDGAYTYNPLNLTILSNYTWSLSTGTVTKPLAGATPAPGTFTAGISGGTTGGTGTTSNRKLTLSVSALGLTTATPGTYTGGSVTVTITPDA